MTGDLAVVLDVAGTILFMHRIAKDIHRGVILEGVITWELIMEKTGRSLVVPQISPFLLATCHPEKPLSALARNREKRIEISCSNGTVSREKVLEILYSTKAKIRELQEVHRIVLLRCDDTYLTAGLIVDIDLEEITHVISTGGLPYPSVEKVLNELKNAGADIYLASGDSLRCLMNLKYLGVDLGHVFPTASPRKKEKIVLDLKKKYRQVIMVGDGLNDIHALKAANFGILTIQQDTHPPPLLCNAADKIISDIRDLPEIVRGLDN